jgi:hypothetical protein
MIQDILKKSKEEKELIGVWILNDDDGFWCGYVSFFNEDILVLKHYTKYGKYDGIIVLKMENIESIDYDDDYLKGLEYVISNEKKLELEEQIDMVISNTDNWQNEVLETALGNPNRIVRVQVNNDSYYNGLVDWLDEQDVALTKIGDDGQVLGKSVYPTANINLIRMNDIDNRKKLLLYKWRMSQHPTLPNPNVG